MKKQRTAEVIRSGVVCGVTEMIAAQLRHLQVHCRGLVMGFPALVGKDNAPLFRRQICLCRRMSSAIWRENLEDALGCRSNFPATLTFSFRLTWLQHNLQQQEVLAAYLGTGMDLPSG
ncbi:hypothetical protein [Enterobacter hormaechei]|uniref:hypothetical protein n=1 Tax=Enterobacter hormaechei TaxID=158836 RepID=UPI003D1D8A49